MFFYDRRWWRKNRRKKNLDRVLHFKLGPSIQFMMDAFTRGPKCRFSPFLLRSGPSLKKKSIIWTVLSAMLLCSLTMAVVVEKLDDAGFLGAELPIPTCRECVWTDIRTIGVNGRADFPSYPTRKSYVDRLPADAEGVVRDAVWSLSEMSAGFYSEFETASSQIYLNITYTRSIYGMYHFPPTGMSGMDLYAWCSNSSSWRYTSTTVLFPVAGSKTKTAVNHMAAVKQPDGSPTKYRLHLPTYNGVANLFIGHDAKSTLSALKPAGLSKKPVVWYGTSILQGGVASRPGMIFTNAISRNIRREIKNFGFSGNGIMELTVAKYLVDIDAAMYIIDCLPNMEAVNVTQNTVPLVKFLRAKHPTVPIILAAGTWYGDHWFDPSRNDEKRAALIVEYDKLVAAGDPNLHLVANEKDELFDGDALINPTVAGTHPSDLGHYEIANFYTKLLPTLLD